MMDIVGRAESVLRRRYGLEAGEASALLVGISEQQNRTLDSVAQAAVARFDAGVSVDHDAPAPGFGWVRPGVSHQALNTRRLRGGDSGR
jgi:hypothetical protein